MAGAPCPVEVMQKVLNKMHMSEVLIAYGQTETSPVNHMTTVEDSIEKRVSSVGRPAPHCEIKIIDVEGAVVPVGEKGEICCRGYSVMLGYWGDEERTAETIDSEGWLHSGDIGIMDAEGYTQVTGRIKDMIIRGGENIYPAEVEQAITELDAVGSVAVIGVPDEKFGEAVKAVVVLRAGMTATDAEIMDFCKGRLGGYKRPRSVDFAAALPRNPSGKILKRNLRLKYDATA